MLCVDIPTQKSNFTHTCTTVHVCKKYHIQYVHTYSKISRYNAHSKVSPEFGTCLIQGTYCPRASLKSTLSSPSTAVHYSLHALLTPTLTLPHTSYLNVSTPPTLLNLAESSSRPPMHSPLSPWHYDKLALPYSQTMHSLQTHRLLSTCRLFYY